MANCGRPGRPVCVEGCVFGLLDVDLIASLTSHDMQGRSLLHFLISSTLLRTTLPSRPRRGRALFSLTLSGTSLLPRVRPWRKAESYLLLFHQHSLRFMVHNGKDYVPVTVTQDMVGHKLGEFAITRKRFTYKCVSTVFVFFTLVVDSLLCSAGRPRISRLSYSRPRLYSSQLSHCYSIVASSPPPLLR